MSPIDCREVLRHLELYLDGELGGDACVEIEQHLVSCVDCSGHSDFQRKLKALLRTKCGCDEVPQHVAERVRVVLRRESTEP